MEKELQPSSLPSFVIQVGKRSFILLQEVLTLQSVKALILGCGLERGKISPSSLMSVYLLLWVSSKVTYVGLFLTKQ